MSMRIFGKPKPEANVISTLVKLTEVCWFGLDLFFWVRGYVCHCGGDVLRVLHPDVISQIFDDFPHRCGVCEGQLKFQDQVDRHLEWHYLTNQTSNSNKASQVWYAGSSVNTLTSDSYMVSANEQPSGPQEGALIKRMECIEPMVVPADESQCLCILCGELFEDFYDQGIAQWMFKAAVYGNVPCCDVISVNINEVVG